MQSASPQDANIPQHESSAAKKVPFAIGPKKFAKGDEVVIQEVWSELGSLANGDTVTVKSICTLSSHSTATLLFSITQDGTKGLQPGKAIKRPAQAGTEPFELKLPITVDGHLHIALYETQTNRNFGNVYFGTSAQMAEIAHWELDRW